MPLSWGASEMYQQILFAAFGSTILFGVALIWALRAERRQGNHRAALKSDFHGNIERGKRRCVLTPVATAA